MVDGSILPIPLSLNYILRTYSTFLTAVIGGKHVLRFFYNVHSFTEVI
jgi:hypothetical protein